MATAAQKTGTECSVSEVPDSGWFETREVCQILGRNRSTVYALAKAGHLFMNRPGRSRPKFRRAEVLALAKANGLMIA